MIKQLANNILTPEQYQQSQKLRNCIYLRLAPKACISMLFRSVLGYDMNWSDPQDLNEKINWFKLYGDTRDWVRLADKYRMRKYVTERGYADMLVPLIGKWERVEDIDWDALPDQFVMKMNNGSGDILICTNKSNLDIDSWKKKYKRLFRRKFGTELGELHYAKMKPCLIAEQLLDINKQPIETTSLIDYKLWCFDGEVAYIMTCSDRKDGIVDLATYDLTWQKHPEYNRDTPHCRRAAITLPRPASLDKMIQAAKDLSKGHPQVRIDFYEVDGKPYLGELTFTSNSGYMDYYTREFMLELGKKVKLK